MAFQSPFTSGSIATFQPRVTSAATGYNPFAPLYLDKFAFTKLSTELQIKILDLLKDNANNDRRYCQYASMHNDMRIKTTGAYGPLLAMAQSCRLIRAWLLPALYKDITFVLRGSTDPDVTGWELRNAGQPVPIPEGIQYKHVTRLQIVVRVTEGDAVAFVRLMEIMEKGKNITNFRVTFGSAEDWDDNTSERLAPIMSLWQSLEAKCKIDMYCIGMGILTSASVKSFRACQCMRENRLFGRNLLPHQYSAKLEERAAADYSYYDGSQATILIKKRVKLFRGYRKIGKKRWDPATFEQELYEVTEEEDYFHESDFVDDD